MKKVIIEFNAEKMCAWCDKNNFEIIEVIENED
jgi:hypothetical protein